MDIIENRLEFIDNYIRFKSIASSNELLQKLNCSARTFWRYITKINGLSSYTHGGKFITIKDIPVFDENGIWFYNEIGFTKFNTSRDLIVDIIDRNEKGISRIQLEKMLRINISKQIQILLKEGRLNRVKLGNRYIYISEKLKSDKKQKLKILYKNKIEEYYDITIKISDLIAVLKVVLVEKKIEFKELGIMIKKYSISIPIKKVEHLIIKYNLFEKKTP